MSESPKNARSGSRTEQWVLCLVLVVLLAVFLPGLGIASPLSHPPRYALQIAHGEPGEGDSWKIWIYGNHEGRRCWRTEVTQDALPQLYETCGFSVPRSPWQLAASGAVGHGTSVLFFLTRPGVSALKVHVKMMGQRGPRVLRLSVRTLSRREAQSARLGSPVGYVVSRIHGRFRGIGTVNAIE